MNEQPPLESVLTGALVLLEGLWGLFRRLSLGSSDLQDNALKVSF